MNRFDKIRKQLAVRELDAVLLNCEVNRFYAGGMKLCAEDDGAVLVTRDEAYFFTDFRYIEAARQIVSGAVIEVVGNGKGYTALINDAIRRHGIKRMGYDDEHLTVARFEVCRKSYDCELVPSSDMFRELRRVKAPDELDSMIAAQRIAERAYTELLNDIRPGITERQLAARLIYLMLYYGAEDKSFDPIVVSGPNSSKPHGVPGSREIQKGDFVTMDLGCIYKGYCSDMTRTVAVGHASDEMRLVYGTVLSAQLAGIEAVKAGVTGREADAAARDVIAAAGYGDCFGHSFGHGVGIEIHEAPNLSPSNTSPLPAGAVVSAEPGIYLAGKFGVRIEDVLIVTDDGSIDITNVPKELIIL